MEEHKAKKIVEEILEDHKDLFLVDMKLKGAIGNQKLLVFIDGDDGLNIDRCGQISKKIGMLLEEQEVIESKYTLEVSSPGLDFPITNKRQYKKNIDRKLAINLKEGSRVEGKLIAVGEEGLSIIHAGQSKEIAWDEIEESKIKISFK